jgi:hypothetical protein
VHKASSRSRCALVSDFQRWLVPARCRSRRRPDCYPAIQEDRPPCRWYRQLSRTTFIVNLRYETQRTIVNKQSAKIASLVVAAAAFSMISLAGPTGGGASKAGQEGLAYSMPLPIYRARAYGNRRRARRFLTSAPPCRQHLCLRAHRHHPLREFCHGPCAREYKAGESFFEPPGSVHLVTANASETEPASLLAFFIVDDGATLTMPGK